MVLSNEIQIITENEYAIEFSLFPEETVFQVGLEDLVIGETSVIGSIIKEDQVLFLKDFSTESYTFYIKNNRILAGSLSHYLNFFPGATSFAFEYEAYIKEISLKQTNETSVSLFTSAGQKLYTFNDIAAYESPEHRIPVDLAMTSVEFRYLLAGKITYGQFNTFLIYDLFRKEMVTRNFRFKMLSNKAGLDIRLNGPEVLDVSCKEDRAAIDFMKITGRGVKVFDFYQLEEHREKHMLASFSINDLKYYIHNKQNGIYLTKGNASKISGYESGLKALFTSKYLYLYGRSTHYAYKASNNYNNLYTDGREEAIATFKRPWKTNFFRRFGFFKIPVSVIAAADEQQLALYIGDDTQPLHPLKLNMDHKKEKIVSLKKRKGDVLLLVSSKRGNVSIGTSLHPEEYTLQKRIYNWFHELKNNKRVLQLFKILFILIGRLPKTQNMVIFESFHAKQYSDSPRAIYEYMKEHHQNYRLLWSIDKSAENMFREFGVPYLRRFTIPWFFHFPRAKYWVNNVRLPAWMPKPKDTIYIQTWHGTPLKKLGVDIEEIHMPGTNTSAYKRNFVLEAQKWDYLVSPNPYSTEIFRRAFRYPGKIIESGYPRNDVLSNHSETLASNLKKKLGIAEDKKVMLYAPTWRDNEFYEKGKYKFEFQFNLDNWKKEFGDEWVLLSRMHYLVAENFDFSAHAGTVYDASSYPDIRDLYLISDLLITDYSSVFFDFAVLNRPIIFFMYDFELYRDQLRGFYINIEEEAPGPIVETEKELFLAINSLKDSNVQSDPKFSGFKGKFSSLEDGQATERVVKAFLE
ncbi:CDP-glycerol glycerophosphotransferase family protein [Planomicrobium sp. Y74]|uniref:CDP-glycerol glycerophosphotransferase family protein n=1 Tax=Planomicrobium sp. Y74 TaxID=2478977 RepID=UPI00256FD3B1|nr:CDP-glycerol glycerophosphotransferase family protein [Planomicrobium sp. Y74]